MLRLRCGAEQYGRSADSAVLKGSGIDEKHESLGGHRSPETGADGDTCTLSLIHIFSSVDVSMYEAAKVDGASKLQKIWFIDLPSILPTIIILLILNAGQIMNLGFDKVYLMQNQLNVQVSEIIATYTYKVGLLDLDFSYSTAIGLRCV